MATNIHNSFILKILNTNATRNGKFVYLMWYKKENTEIYQNHNFLWYKIINKHKGSVAQLVECKTLNLVVVGSNLIRL